MDWLWEKNLLILVILRIKPEYRTIKNGRDNPVFCLLGSTTPTPSPYCFLFLVTLGGSNIAGSFILILMLILQDKLNHKKTRKNNPYFFKIQNIGGGGGGLSARPAKHRIASNGRMVVMYKKWRGSSTVVWKREG